MNDAKSGVSIRSASPDDAVLISVLAATTFYEAYFEQDDSYDLTNYIRESFDLERVREEIADAASHFLIAELDKKAVGYARLIANSRHYSIATENSVELRRIYVLERVWRTGVGETLLSRSLETAGEIGAPSIWLGVWEQNVRAQRFYLKHGFVQRGTLEFPYGESVGINLVMEKLI